MKRILGVLAAGVLAIATGSVAMAQDAAVSTEMKAAAPAAAAPKEIVLQNGTHVWVDAEGKAWVNDATGAKVAAPTGDHVQADGTTLTVKDGMVVTAPAMAPAAH